jgi:hypothetical protein
MKRPSSGQSDDLVGQLRESEDNKNGILTCDGAAFAEDAVAIHLAQVAFNKF